MQPKILNHSTKPLKLWSISALKEIMFCGVKSVVTVRSAACKSIFFVLGCVRRDTHIFMYQNVPIEKC